MRGTPGDLHSQRLSRVRRPRQTYLHGLISLLIVSMTVLACGQTLTVEVPLPTLDVPLPGQGAVVPPPSLSQEDSRWAGHRLGYNTDPKYSIGSHGCFITSVSALFNSYLPGYTDPTSLNRALKDKGGYVAGTGNLKWGVASKLRPPGVNHEFKPKLDFKWAKVDAELAAHRPVLVPVKGPVRSHIVVIWDVEDSGANARYRVLDPQKGGSYVWTRKTASHTGDNGSYRITGLTTFGPT